MTCIIHAPQKCIFSLKSAFLPFGDVENSILKELAQKGQQRLYFTQLFVLISNFELKIINSDLAVLSRGPTGPWIDVQRGSRTGFSDQNCSILSIFEYCLFCD
jgi:hypothetical protein